MNAFPLWWISLACQTAPLVISCAVPTPLNKSSRSYIYIQICLDQNGPRGDTRRQIEEVSILTLPRSLSSGCLPPSLLFSLPLPIFSFPSLCLCTPSFIFTLPKIFFILLTLFIPPKTTLLHFVSSLWLLSDQMIIELQAWESEPNREICHNPALKFSPKSWKSKGVTSVLEYGRRSH